MTDTVTATWSAPTPLRAILLGRPGSGKGTQGARLSEMLGIPHLSTGDLLRQEIESGNALGRDLERYVARGRLVPDRLVLEVIQEHLDAIEVRELGFLLDGFPRSVTQLIALERMIAPQRLSCALELLLPEREAGHRLLTRFVCTTCGSSPHMRQGPALVAQNTCMRCGGELRRRLDDDVTSIRQRFTEFERLTKPLVEWLDRRGVLLTVDAARTPDEVTTALLTSIERVAPGVMLPQLS